MGDEDDEDTDLFKSLAQAEQKQAALRKEIDDSVDDESNDDGEAELDKEEADDESNSHTKTTYESINDKALRHLDHKQSLAAVSGIAHDIADDTKDVDDSSDSEGEEDLDKEEADDEHNSHTSVTYESIHDKAERQLNHQDS